MIGDKQAEGVALRLRARPWLLDRLRATVGVPLRVVVVVRNAYDTIATMALRAAGGGRPDVEAAARRYLELCETVERVRAELEPEELRELRHESFVAEPRAALRDLCDWLDLTPSETYLDACASIVSPSPHRSRHAVLWEARTRSDVERAIDSLPALRGYDFDD